MIDLEMLTKKVQKLIELAEQVPERYRNQLFGEVLGHVLRHMVEGQEPRRAGEHAVAAVDRLNKGTQLEDFMKEHAVTDAQLKSVLDRDGDYFVFLREPKFKTKARAQREWALLNALKNALETGRLETSEADLREKCVNARVFDSKNFATNLKQAPLKSYFVGVLDGDDKKRLSPEGSKALAELIKSLTPTK